jgi:hypothetical protein
METVWFDELPPYPVRSFTYRNEQVRAYTVSRVIVYEPFNAGIKSICATLSVEIFTGDFISLYKLFDVKRLIIEEKQNVSSSKPIRLL